MKIKFLRNIGKNEPCALSQAGSTADVSDKVAAYFIDKGWAVDVTPKEPPKEQKRRTTKKKTEEAQ